jgi:hypothetical protein
LHKASLRAGANQLVCGRAGILDISKDDRGALGCEATRCGEPYSRLCTCDDGDLLFHSHLLNLPMIAME